MRGIIYRLIGLSLIVASIGGLFASLAGLVFIWRGKPIVQAKLDTTLLVLENSLDITAQGLVVAEQSLQATVSGINSLEVTVGSTAVTIESTTPMLDNLIVLSQETLPDAVSAAQTSLVSAQSSARVIDAVMNSLAALPFVNYEPGVPLATALGQVATSLNDVPLALAGMGASLVDTSGNLQIVQADIALVAADLGTIATSIESSVLVIDQYQVVVTDLTTQVLGIKSSLPAMLDALVWGLTILLVWLVIAQFGLLVQGWEIIERGRRKLKS